MLEGSGVTLLRSHMGKELYKNVWPTTGSGLQVIELVEFCGSYPKRLAVVFSDKCGDVSMRVYRKRKNRNYESVDEAIRVAIEQWESKIVEEAFE